MRRRPPLLLHAATRPPLLLVAAAMVLIAACGGTAGTGAEGAANTVAGVGRLPTETIPAVTFPPDLSVDFTLPALDDSPTGSRAVGNRLLMIGDSLFAGVSRRYSNEACEQLVPLDWQVLIEAEPGRAVDFGARVLDRRLDEGWDAFVIELGTNYGGDEQRYFEILDGMLTDVGDRPVVLLTTTEFRPEQREVNEAIAFLAAKHRNVSVVDWTGISEMRGVLSGDGVHPTPNGQVVLVAAVAQMLGRAPSGPGDCLDPEFTDDSLGRGVLPDTTSRGARTRPRTTTTAVGSATTVGATAAPVTEPPATAPPATVPPVTDPPTVTSPVTPPPTGG